MVRALHILILAQEGAVIQVATKLAITAKKIQGTRLYTMLGQDRT